MDHRRDDELEHQQAWAAIPWVVNGSASEAQHRLIDAHTRSCGECQEELRRQRALRAAMNRNQGPLSAAVDPEAGLEKLLRRIDQASEESDAAPAARAHARERRRGPGALVYGLSLALVIESIGISLLGIGLLSRTGQAPAYQTLSSSPESAVRETIRIVPAADMRLGDLAQLLRGLDLQIASGPNAEGAYALASSARPAALQDQIARLRTSSGLRLVEPIRPGGPRP